MADLLAPSATHLAPVGDGSPARGPRVEEPGLLHQRFLLPDDEVVDAAVRVHGETHPRIEMFAGSSGDPIDSSTAYRAVKAAATKAGVPWAGPHALRHTCATLLFRNGLNAKQVQLWLGHHSPAFTLATYVHLLPDDIPDVAFLDVLTDSVVPDAVAADAHAELVAVNV